MQTDYSLSRPQGLGLGLKPSILKVVFYFLFSTLQKQSQKQLLRLII